MIRITHPETPPPPLPAAPSRGKVHLKTTATNMPMAWDYNMHSNLYMRHLTKKLKKHTHPGLKTIIRPTKPNLSLSGNRESTKQHRSQTAMTCRHMQFTVQEHGKPVALSIFLLQVAHTCRYALRTSCVVEPLSMDEPPALSTW